jgi:acyl-CoA synthetase (NDP forming)
MLPIENRDAVETSRFFMRLNGGYLSDEDLFNALADD